MLVCKRSGIVLLEGYEGKEDHRGRLTDVAGRKESAHIRDKKDICTCFRGLEDCLAGTRDRKIGDMMFR